MYINKSVTELRYHFDHLRYAKRIQRLAVGVYKEAWRRRKSPFYIFLAKGSKTKFGNRSSLKRKFFVLRATRVESNYPLSIFVNPLFQGRTTLDR
jgi:hypothetical protein